MLLMGLTRFRQRELAKTATREAMDVIQAKTVNAEKANTLGTVKVTMGKNFRFGRQASNDSAVLLAA
jgi:FAD synthase